jgi:hypothetical protein
MMEAACSSSALPNLPNNMTSHPKDHIPNAILHILFPEHFNANQRCHSKITAVEEDEVQ